MAVSKRLRYEVLRRDNHTCRYCGAAAPDVPLTVDHVVPVALGGRDEPSNLAAACRDCNSGKSSVPADAALVDDVAQDALRWARAMETAAVEFASKRSQAVDDHDEFITKWNSWTYEYQGERRTISIADSWPQSIDQFMAAGLSMDGLHELVDVAMNSRADDVWRYFCGCCWKRITDLQDRARELLNEAMSDPHAISERDWAVITVAEELLDA